MNLWRLALDLFFPLSTQIQEFLRLDDTSLKMLIHIHHDRTRSIHSLFVYRTPIIRVSIQALKYHKNKEVAKRYAQILAPQILEETGDLEYALIPIPPSKRRMQVHGFNQCLLITKALVPRLGNRFIHRPDCLKRSDTQLSQTRLAKLDRLANVHGAFMATQDLTGKDVVLIDDVWTTGATAREAMNACRAAGARSVAVWTIAH